MPNRLLRKALVCALALGGLGACSAVAGLTEPAVTATHLDGAWNSGTGAEPAAGIHVKQCSLQNIGASWTFKQQGNAITATRAKFLTHNVTVGSTVSGTLSGTSLTLTGTEDVPTEPGAAPDAAASDAAATAPKPTTPQQDVTYQLKFDPQTQHLVGTVGGTKVWFVPVRQYEKDTTSRCPVS